MLLIDMRKLKENILENIQPFTILILLLGIVALLAGVFLTPAIAEKYLSSDGEIERRTLRILRFLRIASVVSGVLIVLYGILSIRWPKLTKVSNVLRKKTTLYLLVFLSLIYIFIGFNQGLNIYDEGLAVYGPTRVMEGDILYKDFWAPYGPAPFYILAGVFSLFGTSLIVERILAVVVVFGIAMFTYLIASKIVPRKFALVAFLLPVIWVGGWRFTANPLALFFSLLSIFFIIKYLSTPTKQWLWLILGGTTAGLVTLTKHNTGAYVIFASFSMIFLFNYTNQSKKGKSAPRQVLGSLKACLPYIISVAALLLPPAIYFLSTTPLTELRHVFIIFPSKYPQFRALPYPVPPSPISLALGKLHLSSYIKETLRALPYYLPWITYSVAIGFIIQKYKKSDYLNKPRLWQVILVELTGLLFLTRVMVRSDFGHLSTTLPVSAILLAFLMYEMRQSSKIYKYAYYALFFVLIFASFLGPVKRKLTSIYPPSFSFEVRRAKGIHVRKDFGKPYQKAISYVQNNTTTTEKIFVGNTEHDRIYINDVMFYFLSARQSATKYHQYEPVFTTTSRVQKEMVEDIKANDVNLIVLVDQLFKQEPNASARSSGVNILDDFIDKNYKKVKEFGDYSILKKI